MDDVIDAYARARKKYGEYGVDVDRSLRLLAPKEISIHCWQGDDVRGFEKAESDLSGGLMATGNYPGRAGSPDELRMDIAKALSLIPGRHRVNIHATYGSPKDGIDRDGIEPEQYQDWISWAKALGIGLDFNATLFSHKNAETGFTLSSQESRVRKFWIEHLKRSRDIAEYIGKEQKSACIHNLWIPDGMKDSCIDKIAYRKRLLDSLDNIYIEAKDPQHIKDSIEPKLFGLGSESFVVGSHDFYLGYALTRGLMICLDLGHYHPTESVSDKISSILSFMPEMMVHVSRGVRWDSDHVPILDDQVSELGSEIVRCNAIDRVYIALDYFDASINRIGAWIIGAKSTQKSILRALIEPTELLKEAEEEGDYFRRLALLEEFKDLPFSAVWDYYCLQHGVPIREKWIEEVKQYERDVLRKRY